jgi:hypothetical protein
VPDETYTTLTNQMKITNPQLYTIHETGQPTGLSSAKCISTFSLAINHARVCMCVVADASELKQVRCRA